MNKLYRLTMALLCAVACCGCNDEDENPFIGTDNYISNWNVVLGEENYAVPIAGNEITLTVPEGTDLSGAEHHVVICEHATIAPDPNTVTSWDSEQIFTVTSYTGEEREYKFNVRYSAISVSGGFTLNTQAEVDAFANSNASVIDGVVNIATQASEDTIKNLHALSKITEISGILTIGSYYYGEDLQGLENIQSLGGLEIRSGGSDPLSSIELKNLRKIDNHLNMPYAATYEKIEIPYLETVNGNVSIQGTTASLNLNSLKYVGGTLHFLMADEVTRIEFPSLEHAIAINSTSKKLEYAHFPELSSCQEITSDSKNLSLSIPKLSELSGKLDIKTEDYAALLSGLNKIGRLVINNAITDLDLTGKEIGTLEFGARISSSLCTITNGTDSFHGNFITTAGFPNFGDIKHIYGDVSICQKGVMTIEGIEEIEGSLHLEAGLPPQFGYCTGLIAPQLQKLGNIAFSGDNLYFSTFKCPQLTTYGGDLKFALGHDWTLGDILELDIEIPLLKRMDGSLIINGYYEWTGETDNVENLAPFQNMESCKKVQITQLGNIKSFSGLAKIAGNLSDEANWEVTDNAFNPTLEEMKAGKTEITDF